MVHREYCEGHRCRVLEEQHLKLVVPSRSRRRTVILLAAISSFIAAAQTPTSSVPELSLLTSARQVLDLGLEVARQLPHPVCVQGMVTYVEPGTTTIYIQDHTGGLRVNYTNAFRPVFGQSVIVQGAATASQIIPVIDRAEVRL